MDRLEIWRGYDHVGTVIKDGQGRLHLAYDPLYDGHPLSLSIPKDFAAEPSTVSNYLDGLLPDSFFIRSRWANHFRVREDDTLGLLAAVGEEAPGAFQFLLPGEEPNEGGVDPISDSDVAERIRILRLDKSRWLPQSHAGQFSLAGTQAKFALQLQGDGSWGLPWGLEATTHILKPATSRDFESIDSVEAITLDAARRVGIDVPKSHWTKFGNYTTLVTKRYDRVEVNGQTVRIHQEDFCQVLGLHTDKKYTSSGGPNASDLLRVIREHSLAPDVDSQEFVRTLAFNHAVRGTDAHAKNYSLLHTDAGVRLAPAYDLISFLPYASGQELLGLQSALNVGGQSKFQRIGEKEWIKFARSSGADPDEVLPIVYDVFERAPSALEDAVNASSNDLDPETLDLWVSRTGASSRLSLPEGLRAPLVTAPKTQARQHEDSGAVWVQAHTRRGVPVEGHWRKRPQS